MIYVTSADGVHVLFYYLASDNSNLTIGESSVKDEEL